MAAGMQNQGHFNWLITNKYGKKTKQCTWEDYVAEQNHRIFTKGENNEQSIFSPTSECFESCGKGESDRIFYCCFDKA